MSDKFQDECGVFGVYGHADALRLTLRGLSALQHRGQESAGVAFAREDELQRVTAMGTVKDLIPHVPATLTNSAIGHVRYGTSGGSSIDYAQPFISDGPRGRIALCHNGHIVNLKRLREMLPPGDEFDRANDSQLLARRVGMLFTSDLAGAVRKTFHSMAPAYSVLVLSSDTLCAVRDPLGMRPLSVGRKGNSTIVSSETCALEAIGVTDLRDVHPGEIVVASAGGLNSVSCVSPRGDPAQCIFELIYFGRPDSVIFGHSVAEFRQRLGERLAHEAPVTADVVVPVPDSAVFGGLGYARASGIELSMALFRTDAVGRSFIEPTSEARTRVILAKISPITSLIEGRRVILVDDSIVRGNTCLHLVRMLRNAGAREVHVRVTSPPTIASCHFGIDTPDERELFAHGRNATEMRQLLGADSLEFLSMKGLLETAAPTIGFCSGCFSGIYPINVNSVYGPAFGGLDRE